MLEMNKLAIAILLCAATAVVVHAAVIEPDAAAVTGTSCNRVTTSLSPCVGYLQGRKITTQCCTGVKAVAATAKTPQSRRNACKCLQDAAKSFKDINYGNVANLPARCGVKLPFKITRNMDCSRIG